MRQFKRVQKLEMFSWVPRLVDGYDTSYLNSDEGAPSLQKRLTMLQNERARKDAEKLGFTQQEHKSISEFFNQELKRTDARAVMACIEFMFKDIENTKLRQYFVEGLAKAVGYQSCKKCIVIIGP